MTVIMLQINPYLVFITYIYLKTKIINTQYNTKESVAAFNLISLNSKYVSFIH